jgi:hypothetical protein
VTNTLFILGAFSPPAVRPWEKPMKRFRILQAANARWLVKTLVSFQGGTRAAGL